MYDERTIREWAYDPDRDFIDDDIQDEDLILGLAPPTVLLPLIDDPLCPKAGYLLACLDFHEMFSVLRGDAHHLDEVRVTADLARRCKTPELQAWATLLDRRLSYRAGVGPVDRHLALTMGHDLLNGPSRNCDIMIVDETPSSWTVQLSVAPDHRHSEWLEISKSTGMFRFLRNR